MEYDTSLGNVRVTIMSWSPGFFRANSPSNFEAQREALDVAAFETGKVNVVKGIIDHSDYGTYQLGVKDFKKAASHQPARAWLTDLYLSAEIPLLKFSPAIPEKMRKDPAFFAENAMLREYHFKRYLKNNDKVQQYLAAFSAVAVPALDATTSSSAEIVTPSPALRSRGF
jgi:hypothetical protein